MNSGIFSHTGTQKSQNYLVHQVKKLGNKWRKNVLVAAGDRESDGEKL